MNAKCEKLFNNRIKNSTALYKQRGQMIVSTLEKRQKDFCDGWFCFQPLEEDSPHLRKYLFRSKEEYEHFINDNSYLYPCTPEFSL